MRQFARLVRNAVPRPWRASPTWSFLRACYGRCVNIPHALEYRCAQLARTARLLLRAAGLPLKRQFLVLRCMERSQAVGLFSELSMVLGALEHYERWRTHYAGLRVDFATGGLYYDPSFGTNWWEYYFEPLDIGSTDGAVASELSPLRHDIFEGEAGRLSRKRGFEIINRYVRPKPHIRKRVESYVREHFQDAFVVGIHYRGTDHSESTPPVPCEQVRAAILAAVGAANSARYKLFLATDEQAFLDYMRAVFPENLVYRKTYRSVDGKPIHLRDVNNHETGEDAVIDCLLLSHCQYLVRTESNLSLCSTLFNPELQQVLLYPPCQ